ncbi:hypothetical protein AB0B85_17055 [Micromonospora sp. NPDC049044]|uniref:hypothetical protein n=1 Tax=unclassified Micromonospora TaxID=2617518 RepID=UPI0033D5BEBD
MSGMTGGRYLVETAAERLAQEQRAQWQQFVQARGELAALRAEADAYRRVYGSRIAKIPGGAKARPDQSPGRIATATADVALLVRRERDKLRDAVLAAARGDVGGLLGAPPTAATNLATRRRQWDDSLTQATARPGATVPTATPAADTGSAPDAEAARHQAARVDRAAELFARLPASTPDEVRRSCAAAVAEISAGPTASRAHLLLRDLERRVRVQARAEERIGQVRRDLLAIAAPVETVPGAVAEEFRQRIEGLVAERVEHVPDGLRAEAAAIVEQADRARRRKAVADVLRLGLTDLGYQVDEGFETRLAGTGVAYAAMNGDSGYGVKVLLDRDDPVVRTQVVRADGRRASAAQDRAAEQQFCDDYQVVRRRARRNGVPIEEIGRREPGERPVQVVAETAIPAANRRPNEQRREQQR